MFHSHISGRPPLFLHLLFALTLACADKSDDSADGTPSTDAGTTDAGTTDAGTTDGGTTDGGWPGDGGGPCPYDWTGAPCSHEWEGLYNCDECTVSYTCRETGEPPTLQWQPVTVPCECVDLATGALLTHLPGCEEAGATTGTTSGKE